ncbi:MAG: protein kinase, partial [Pseudomonadota bacterium]
LPFVTATSADLQELEGQELAQMLQTYPNGLPDEIAWPIIEGMVLGLMHAHEEGVVHADFKPGNVYVTNRHATKILDFGIARAMRTHHGGEDTDFDPSRLAALTPAYASREMLNGDNAEPRDDLYSLGVVIYMVLTGCHPYGRVPADEAIKEGLQPERIRSMSRRRWRALEKCLMFNRQDRPAQAAELYEGLFGKAAWRSWSGAAAAAIIAVSLLFTSVQEQAEISEVKQEVRTETLVGAQIERISDLLAEPRFDVEWERTLFSELQTLRTVSPDSAIETQMVELVSSTYAGAIAETQNLDESFRLYQAAAQFAAQQASGELLEARLLSLLQALAGQPLSADWLADTEQTLSYVQREFPESADLAAARSAVLHQLFDTISGVFRREVDGDMLLAEQAWNTFAQAAENEAQRSEIDALLQLVLEDAAERRAVQAAAQLKRDLFSRIDKHLNVSCLRLDIAQTGAAAESIIRQYPAYRQQIVTRASSRISECVSQVGAVDPDRGRSMQRRAQAHFADDSKFSGPGVDPCSMHYLVGNGRRAGAGGYCADDLLADQVNGADLAAQTIVPALSGPHMVVVPGEVANSKFAISKYEISWKDFNVFCRASDLCAASEEQALPVTGVPVEVVEQYAHWLSQKTGFRYRLPTRQEWLQVASAELPVSSSCAQVGGETRILPVNTDAQRDTPPVTEPGNKFGVVHILGNVREVVKAKEGYFVLGQTQEDEQGRCLLETSEVMNPQGDGLTGFRLVREVS